MKTFLPKFTNFLAMRAGEDCCCFHYTSSYSIAQPPTNNSEHDICKLCNTCASSLVLWLSKLKIKSYLKEIFHQVLTFHAGHNNCTIHEFLLECNVCGESWPIIIITERSNETRSEQYGVNLLGISLSIKLVDPSYIKKDRYLSYLYIIYHLFCQKEQTFIVFCKKSLPWIL